MKEIERETGKKFGSEENTLLVSVRSGAPLSMPGMLDTVLNLGINDRIADRLQKSMERSLLMIPIEGSSSSLAQ